jgi:hypothetical protein
MSFEAHIKELSFTIPELSRPAGHFVPVAEVQS